MEHRPDTYLSMGLSVEGISQEFGITRADSDAYAMESHRRAIAAQDAGKFDAEIVPVRLPDGTVFSRDEGPRRDPSPEGLARRVKADTEAMAEVIRRNNIRPS